MSATRPPAGLIGRGFAPALAIVEIDVEHVDLVVAGDERAIGREQERAVGDLAVGAQNGGRADMQEDAELGRQPPGGRDDLVLILCGLKASARSSLSRMIAPVISGVCT